MIKEPEFKTPQELYAHYQAVAHRLGNRHYVYPVTPVAKGVSRANLLKPTAAESHARVNAATITNIVAATECVSNSLVTDITPEIFIERLRTGVIPKSRKAAERLIELIAFKHGRTFGELIGSSRAMPIVMARREAFWALHTYFEFSLKEVGRVLRKDHTSVLHGVRMYEQGMAQ